MFKITNAYDIWALAETFHKFSSAEAENGKEIANYMDYMLNAADKYG